MSLNFCTQDSGHLGSFSCSSQQPPTAMDLGNLQNFSQGEGLRETCPCEQRDILSVEERGLHAYNPVKPRTSTRLEQEKQSGS